MAKDKSFAAKMSKDTQETATCATCGEIRSSVLVVASEKKDNSDSWKFREKIVQVCKCNEKEIYG